MQPVTIYRRLSAAVSSLRFGAPVACVYNPLEYARAPHEAYLKRYAGAPREVVLLGMNPGPWGMAQTGVPFGEVHAVRDWLGISAPVKRPAKEHPKRPIEGFGCARREVSGQRLWGWARERFGSPQRFFERFFVANYCPLVFLETSGRNLTPDRLRATERTELLARCDDALARLSAHLGPRLVVGIGHWAESRARAVLGDTGIEIGRMLHPSPASPIANRGWAVQAEADLRRLGIDLPR